MVGMVFLLMVGFATGDNKKQKFGEFSGVKLVVELKGGN